MISRSDITTRALREKDRPLVLQWRNSERVRSAMYTDHLITEAEHAQWFSSALRADDASYLICELQQRPIGFVSFSQISRLHGRCSWAFYLGEANVPRGAGAAMEFLALAFAFERLAIRKLCCEVFAFNAAVIKLHERFGFQREAYFAKHCLKNGKYEDVVALAKFADAWGSEREPLFQMCFASRAGTK